METSLCLQCRWCCGSHHQLGFSVPGLQHQWGGGRVHSGCQAPLFRDVGWTAWPEGQDNIRVAGRWRKAISCPGSPLPPITTTSRHEKSSVSHYENECWSLTTDQSSSKQIQILWLFIHSGPSGPPRASEPGLGMRAAQSPCPTQAPGTAVGTTDSGGL